MTDLAIDRLGLPVPAEERLYVEAGLEWLQEHTTLELALEDEASIQALPASARLFLVKFCEISQRDAGVASESVGPMSQSFTSESAARQVSDLARQLLKGWLKPGVKFLPCKRRWL